MKILPRHKSRSDQAGFFRRFFAFAFDFALIMVLAIIILVVYFEIRASQSGQPDPYPISDKIGARKGRRSSSLPSWSHGEGAQTLVPGELQGKLRK